MFIASLTFAIAPAAAPGDAVGTDTGEEPIGGVPESEGGRGIFRVVIVYRRCLRRRKRVNMTISCLEGEGETQANRPPIYGPYPSSAVQDVAVTALPALLLWLWPALSKYPHAAGGST
jgi:hypothetical protein